MNTIHIRICAKMFLNHIPILRIIVNENHTSYSNKGIHYEKSPADNYNEMFDLFSTFLIIAKCKYVICGSGNCSIWMMLYRGNNKNVIQYLKGNWCNNISEH